MNRLKAIVLAFLDDLAGHREFRLTLAAVFIAVILRASHRFGLSVSDAEARELAAIALSGLFAFLGHQGLANVGKHAAEAKADAESDDVKAVDPKAAVAAIVAQEAPKLVAELAKAEAPPVAAPPTGAGEAKTGGKA